MVGREIAPQHIMKKYIKRIHGWKQESEHRKRKERANHDKEVVLEDFEFKIKIRPTSK
jgi:hypothetical protein